MRHTIYLSPSKRIGPHARRHGPTANASNANAHAFFIGHHVLPYNLIQSSNRYTQVSPPMEEVRKIDQMISSMASLVDESIEGATTPISGNAASAATEGQCLCARPTKCMWRSRSRLLRESNTHAPQVAHQDTPLRLHMPPPSPHCPHAGVPPPFLLWPTDSDDDPGITRARARAAASARQTSQAPGCAHPDREPRMPGLTKRRSRNLRIPRARMRARTHRAHFDGRRSRGVAAEGGRPRGTAAADKSRRRCALVSPSGEHRGLLR